MYDDVRLRRPRLSGATLLIFAIAGIAACSGQSCSCIQPLPGGFPLAQRRQNGIQTRVTQSLLQYVSDNAAIIVPALIPGGTTFTIPPSCPGSGNQICCGSPQPTCQISLDPRALTITPSAPNKLHFSGNMIVKTVQNLPISTTVGKCIISLDTTRTGAITMTFSGDILVPVDQSTSLASLALSNANIGGIDDGDLNLSEPGSDALCSVANISLVKGFVIDYLDSQVSGLLSNVVGGQLCETCKTKSDCSAVATACSASGQCLGPDGKTCIQVLGIEGRANVGAVLGGLAPPNATIDILEAAGGYATANTGLSLGVLGGTKSDPHSDCVPVVPPGPPVVVSPSASFQGDVIPGTTTPYHVGLGVHVSHLTTLGYAFWDAGGLCLSLGSANFAQLSAKTLGLIMPSLSDLYRGDDAAMALRFRPQNPPVFTLGAGTFKMVGGKNVVDDPLMTLTVKDMAVDFFLFVDDRYVRVATLTADLVLPFGLDTDMSGALVPVAGDVGHAFTNLRVSNAELLAESTDQLAAAFPSLFAASLGGLFSALGSFALPSFAGLSIHPKLITSTDPDMAGHNQYLAIFADVQPAAHALTQPVRTRARIVGVTTPPTAVFAADGRDGREPSVTVEVGGDGPLATAGAIEWSWAFDHGVWHPYQSASTLTLTDPQLWLQGKHIVSLRARVVGDPMSLDPHPADLQFIIDSEPPHGDFTVEGGRIVPHASDRVSPTPALQYRIDGGAFHSLGQTTSLALPAGRSGGDVVLQVQDEAGNIATLPSRFDGGAPHTSGCSVSGDGASGTGIALVAIAAILLLRRRRAALALLVAVPLSACHHGASGGDLLAPNDAIGRTHDVKLHGGALQIAAYDASFGDLAYGKVSLEALDKPFDWVLVDGTDPSAPKDSTTVYRHGQTSPGPDVGFYATLALTNGGDPRIVYYDATTSAVKYAHGGFPFEIHEIDRGSEDGSVQVGMYPAIVLDPYDTPVVAYMATGLGDGVQGFYSEIRLASASNDSPHSHDDWQIKVVDSTPISCAGRCGAGTACVMRDMVGGMPNTNPSLSSCLPTDLAPCMPGCKASQVCVQSVCRDVLTESGPATLPDGTGLFSRLLRSPTDSTLRLVYHDRSLGQLRVATETADGKLGPVVIDGATGGTTGVTGRQDMGQFANAAFGADGSLHLAYVDALEGRLLYRSISPGGTASPSEVADDGVRADGPHPVGASASVLVEGGAISILYQDQGSSDLLMAQRSGGWAHAAVLTDATGAGFSSHLVSDGMAHYYSSWIFDRAKTPVGRLMLDRAP